MAFNAVFIFVQVYLHYCIISKFLILYQHGAREDVCTVQPWGSERCTIHAHWGGKLGPPFTPHRSTLCTYIWFWSSTGSLYVFPTGYLVSLFILLIVDLLSRYLRLVGVLYLVPRYLFFSGSLLGKLRHFYGFSREDPWPNTVCIGLLFFGRKAKINFSYSQPIKVFSLVAKQCSKNAQFTNYFSKNFLEGHSPPDISVGREWIKGLLLEGGGVNLGTCLRKEALLLAASLQTFSKERWKKPKYDIPSH